jgi:hypothetical protein
LASGERIYIWVVLVAIALPAFFRLAIPKRYADLQSEKLRNERSLRHHRILGWITLVGSPLILLYGIFGRLRAWMWLAAVVGIISGADSLSAPWFLKRNRFVAHTVIFGAVGAAAAILIYFFFLRK